MGDRVYLELTIHGKIETVDALDAVTQALEEDGMTADSASDYLGEFQHALEKNFPPVFYDAECNNGELGYVEEVLKRHSVAYSVSHEEGGGFAAACWSWSPDQGKARSFRAHGTGSVIEVTDIEKALRSERPLRELQTLIDIANRADGAGMPEFSVSDQVRLILFQNETADAQ